MSQPHLRQPKPQRLSLLILSGELRNKIYEYVLVRRGYIIVDRCNLAAPALLTTCGQIRNEASGYYYQLNTFRVICWDTDYSALFAFHQRTHSHRVNDLKIVYRGNTNGWNGLLKALRVVHERRLAIPEEAYELSTVKEAAAAAQGAIDIVEELVEDD